jgi:peptide/nickel transport system permease protein
MATPAAEITALAPESPVEAEVDGHRRFRFLASRKATLGLGILAAYVVVAVIGPWVAPYDPGKRHWFGTTHLGQDIFSQMLVGTRSVIFVGFTAGIVATVLAVLIGVTSGYLGGYADEGLSVLANVFLVIPALPLIVLIAGSLPKAGDVMVALVIGFTSWSWNARVLRAQTLSLRRRDYVEAARASGESTWRIIVFEILPNLTAVIAAGFISTVIFAVLSEITLAFIGVSGLSDWNWGVILYWAQSQQALDQGAWWWFVPAGLAITLLGTALSLVNFGIDEFVNPRLRGGSGTRIRAAAGRKVAMRVGFTPVVRKENASCRARSWKSAASASTTASGPGRCARSATSASPCTAARCSGWRARAAAASPRSPTG